MANFTGSIYGTCLGPWHFESHSFHSVCPTCGEPYWDNTKVWYGGVLVNKIYYHGSNDEGTRPVMADPECPNFPGLCEGHRIDEPVAAPAKVVVDQPPSIPTGEKPVWEMVIDDMQDRHQLGIERYGTPLQVTNGRSHLIDAYQEMLDGAAYLRAAIERENRGLPEKPMAMRDAIRQTHKSLHGEDYVSVARCPEAPCIWLIEATMKDEEAAATA